MTNINTGLFSTTAAEIITGFLKYGHEYGSYGIRRFSSCYKVDVAPTNEVVLTQIRNGYGLNIFGVNATVNDVKKWFAMQLKHYTRNQFRSDAAWSRLNDYSAYNINRFALKDHYEAVIGHCPTVAEIYFIYDTFLNRKNISKKYTPELIARIVGKQNDPIAAELEQARRDERIRLEAVCNDEKALAKKKYDEYVANAYTVYKDACTAAMEKYTKAVADLENSTKEALKAFAA